MSGRTAFELSSVQEAATVLDHFNGFHDGLIRRLVVESKDRINKDLSQTCSGVFEVEMDFAHYNYPAAVDPFHRYDQIVRATFRNVQDVFCDFREGFLGNTILGLSVVREERSKGGETTVECCLGLRLARHYYLKEERRYEVRECRLFTFTDAVMIEEQLDNRGQRVGL
jgi:hypothetical protein